MVCLCVHVHLVCSQCMGYMFELKIFLQLSSTNLASGRSGNQSFVNVTFVVRCLIYKNKTLSNFLL